MEKPNSSALEWTQRLPLHIDNVGINPQQEGVNRETGYFCYHWIHTLDGTGEFCVRGETYLLSARQGILLPPHEPHRYRAIQSPWQTWFLTFDGVTAMSIVSAFDIPLSVPLTWDRDSPVDDIHQRLESNLENDIDFAGVNGSLEVYSFLVQLKKYMRVSGRPSLSQWHQKLLPLLTQLNADYGDPTVDLTRMSNVLNVSPQHLNGLFHRVFGVSPYRYLMKLRISKSKELLFSNPSMPIRSIALLVGFQDASHFVATFRKAEGIPPEQFRRQYFS